MHQLNYRWSRRETMHVRCNEAMTADSTAFEREQASGRASDLHNSSSGEGEEEPSEQHASEQRRQQQRVSSPVSSSAHAAFAHARIENKKTAITAEQQNKNITHFGRRRSLKDRILPWLLPRRNTGR